MGSIGISDTAAVDSPCHPEAALSAQPRAALIERPAGSAVYAIGQRYRGDRIEMQFAAVHESNFTR
jgi:hypothetical protein